MNRTQRILTLASAIEYGKDPETAGKSLASIVSFLLKRIPEDKRTNAIRKMIIKLRLMNSEEIAGKDMKPYSSMGQSISLIKNILAGHERMFVRRTLDSIIRNLIY